MSKLIFGLLSGFMVVLSNPAYASLDVQPLNDNNSLRTHIAIPFATKITSSNSSLREVRIRQNSSCKTLIDPYITTNFFVKCTTPGAVTLDIVYLEDGVARSTAYGPFTVANISDTGTVIDDDDTGPSADWLQGQALFNSNKNMTGRQSCAECHSPAEKAHSITLNSLNTALQYYMPTAIPLTANEKQLIINFVRSYR